MSDYQARADFASSWWGAHVLIDLDMPTPARLDLVTRPRVSLRGFLLRENGALHVVAPTARLRGATSLGLRTSDGRSCTMSAPALPQTYEAPLTSFKVCPALAEHPKVLSWAKAPDIGPGRRVWLLEQAHALQPTGAPTPPILVESALLKRAPSPLEPYWMVALKSASGVPLLDDQGAIICVVFRPYLGAKDTSLCTPKNAAFTGIGP